MAVDPANAHHAWISYNGAGLTIVPSQRVLYAATHGRSAWALGLR